MTREEIVNEIKCLLSELNNGEDAVSYLTQNDVKWLNENIKALEQEPILDKVRAEIKKSSHGKWYVGRLDGKTEEVLLLDEVLQILDKYKGRK
jgi:hypothetical protein